MEEVFMKWESDSKLSPAKSSGIGIVCNTHINFNSPLWFQKSPQKSLFALIADSSQVWFDF